MSFLRLLTAQEVHEKNAQMIAQLALETDPDVPMRPSSDDRNRRLRGIPAIGRNVTGAIRNTTPGLAVSDRSG